MLILISTLQTPILGLKLSLLLHKVLPTSIVHPPTHQYSNYITLYLFYEFTVFHVMKTYH